MKRRKVIYVDVDGTLVVGGKPNRKLVELLTQWKKAGFELVLWSAAGREHAEEMAELCGVTDCFSVILSKPGYIVDDVGWKWTRWVKVVRRFAEVLGTTEEG